VSRLRDKARRAGVELRKKWFIVDHKGYLRGTDSGAYYDIGWNAVDGDLKPCINGFHTPGGLWINYWNPERVGSPGVVSQLWLVEVSGHGYSSETKDVWRYMKIIKKVG
jgi:hypothetical protein